MKNWKNSIYIYVFNGSNVIYKMISFDEGTKENTKEHNRNWSKTLDHPCKILWIGDSKTGRANTLINVINHETDVDKIYLYAKDSLGANFQLLKKQIWGAGLKHCNDLKAFLLKIQVTWMIFMKTLMSTIQMKISKYWSYWWYT